MQCHSWALSVTPHLPTAPKASQGLFSIFFSQCEQCRQHIVCRFGEKYWKSHPFVQETTCWGVRECVTPSRPGPGLCSENIDVSKTGQGERQRSLCRRENKINAKLEHLSCAMGTVHSSWKNVGGLPRGGSLCVRLGRMRTSLDRRWRVRHYKLRKEKNQGRRCVLHNLCPYPNTPGAETYHAKIGSQSISLRTAGEEINICICILSPEPMCLAIRRWSFNIYELKERTEPIPQSGNRTASLVPKAWFGYLTISVS